MKKRPTLEDVARQAGVSKATVSAVINGRGSIGAATRQRVLELVEQLNYRHGGALRGATVSADGCIGLVIREINNPYHVEIAAGARKQAEESGYGLLVTSSAAEYQTERKVVERLQSKDLDGLIITPVLHESADLSYLFELKRRSFPFVLLAAIWGVQASLVDVDNIEASRRAVAYLLQEGHSRIAHFAGPRFSMHSQERMEGVRRAFSESHLVFTPQVIVPAGSTVEDGYRAGVELFRGRPRESLPTAITCYNDLVALGLHRALTELDIAVPDDVSIIGYGDLPLLEYLPVPLSTVHVPKFEMGEIAAQMLIRYIEAGQEVQPERVHLETELVIRQTTRSLRTGAEAVVGPSGAAVTEALPRVVA